MAAGSLAAERTGRDGGGRANHGQACWAHLAGGPRRLVFAGFGFNAGCATVRDAEGLSAWPRVLALFLFRLVKQANHGLW